MFALLPLVLIVAGYWYVTGGHVMSTDDAYVNAEKVGISTDVSGIVQDVEVTNNQYVTAGQILYRLDPRQFQIAVDNATANLAQIASTLDAMKQDYKRMLSDAAAEQAQVDLDQTNFNRAEMLLRNGAGTQATYDQAKYTLQTDTSKLQSLRQQAQVQLARLGGNADTPTPELPQYLQAKAQLEEAQRQLNDTVVKAPFSGIVTDVPATAPGRYLAASAPAFFLVDTDHVWVDAQPKETELTYVRVGQSATVTVDAYPNAVWHATVGELDVFAAGRQPHRLQVVHTALAEPALHSNLGQPVILLPIGHQGDAAEMPAGGMTTDIESIRIAVESRGVRIGPGNCSSHLVGHNAQIAVGRADRYKIRDHEMRTGIDEHFRRKTTIRGRTAEPGAAMKVDENRRLGPLGPINVKPLKLARTVGNPLRRTKARAH